MELVIERSKWLRGGPAYESRLMVGDGRMCCLGFYALTQGVTPEQMCDRSSPASLADSCDVRLGALLKEHDANNDTCDQLMRTNDNGAISDASREIDIAMLFKRIDVNVTFVD